MTATKKMTEFFNTPKTEDFLPRKLFQNDLVKIGKCEEDLENILNRFSEFLSELWIKTDGENEKYFDTHGEFVNIWDLCVETLGDEAPFATVSNWIYPDEIYVDYGGVIFEKYPDAFRKIHFLENRREELLNKRERLRREYGDLYDEKAGLYTGFNWHYHPKTKKTA